MHIFDEVRAVLWERGFRTSNMRQYRHSVATDGTSVQTIQIDATGRWLERVDGWGTVERDCDLRDYTGRPGDAVDYVLS